MAVHSAQLAVNAHVATTQLTIYTVPSTKRTIVKSVVIRNQAAAANTFTLYIYSGGVEVMSMVWHLPASGTNGDTAFELPWIVINASQQLRCVAGASFAEIVVSGTELDL